VDTVRSVGDDGVVRTVPREGLFRALTPQAFRTEVLQAAHEGEPDASDDAALVEALGAQVVLVPAEHESPKVTARADLQAAARSLGLARTGIGFDAHAFGGDGPLVLGGVEIGGAPGLAGHSDADVLLHALVDAVLGAAALGDLGEHFPSTDPRWAGADSATFARAAAAKVGEAGWEIGSLDATLILQAPAVAPYRAAMISAIAAAFGVSPQRVSVKASTTDGLGATGRGEGAAAFAIATLYPASI
jgi:2-C-methyl-D-erythritol 4-phosphate cytidylyltransferase / 2-C-methyl-D-erythritol 2,4-cyclodiphosphate synthase